MSSWLDPVRAVLEQKKKPFHVFFRDDDAGWDDNCLMSLLDVFIDQNVPIDVAVIPMALSDSLASELNERCSHNPHLVGVHQHGYAHVNHEQDGRKCEFGVGRSEQAIYRDIRQGKDKLNAKLGQWADPIFTPPWNRCGQVVSDCLNELGFKALSRNSGAQELHLNNLVEISVNIDWCKYRKDPSFSWMNLGDVIAGTLNDTQPTGIMFHHAVMDSEDLSHVSGLLALLHSHKEVRCTLMRDFL